MAGWIDEFGISIEQKSDYLQVFSSFGTNSEGWLQAELLRFLWSRPSYEIEEFRPQFRRYDFWIKQAGTPIWCELKSFSTNYCGLPGKNITNRIQDLLEAMTRVVKRCEQDGGIPLVLALLYPFCESELEIRAWNKHWQRLSAGLLREWKERKIHFEFRKPAYARWLAWTSPSGRVLLFNGDYT